jgi:hypothetical protein
MINDREAEALIIELSRRREVIAVSEIISHLVHIASEAPEKAALD